MTVVVLTPAAASVTDAASSPRPATGVGSWPWLLKPCTALANSALVAFVTSWRINTEGAPPSVYPQVLVEFTMVSWGLVTFRSRLESIIARGTWVHEVQPPELEPGVEVVEEPPLFATVGVVDREDDEEHAASERASSNTAAAPTARRIPRGVPWREPMTATLLRRLSRTPALRGALLASAARGDAERVGSLSAGVPVHGGAQSEPA